MVVSNGVPMGFQWCSYGLPLVFLWGSNGVPIVTCSYQVPMVVSNGVPMGSYGVPMVFQWCSDGVPMFCNHSITILPRFAASSLPSGSLKLRNVAG